MSLIVLVSIQGPPMNEETKQFLQEEVDFAVRSTLAEADYTFDKMQVATGEPMTPEQMLEDLRNSEGKDQQ